MKDLLKYQYIYYKDSSLLQYFSKPLGLYDEGSVFRLADLYIIPKSSIVKIEEKCEMKNSIDVCVQKKCSDRMILTLKSGEQIELGIYDVK